MRARRTDVRVMTRDPEKAAAIQAPGVAIVAGDLEKPETLDAALRGAEKAFLLSSASPKMPKLHGEFIAAAKRAGVRHLVRLSHLVAAADSPIALARWHGEADQLLIDSGIPYTILRPAQFMQNNIRSAQTIAARGAIFVPQGDGRIGQIDIRDIAEVAAAVLTSTGHDGKVYQLTGPEALSMGNVASKLSAALDREIKYVNVPPADAKTSMAARGMPDFLADAMVEWLGMISEGKAETLTTSVKEILAREPNSFDQFAKDYIQAFQSQ